MHGDDFQDDSRRLLRRCEADGLEAVSRNVSWMHGKCRRTDNQGNPFDNNEKLLLSNFHQTDCCEPRAASLQSAAQSFPRRMETPTHPRYHVELSHALECSNSCNNSAPVESKNKNYQ